jgi:hypothetical protein
MHPVFTEYSTLNRRLVNNFLRRVATEFWRDFSGRRDFPQEIFEAERISS